MGRAIKTREPVWTTTARADLVEDHLYIAQDNPVAADRFVLDFDAKVRSFAQRGLSGVKRDEFGRDVRSFVYRDRVIVFLITDEELTVLRVLHGHQDISAIHFKHEEEN